MIRLLRSLAAVLVAVLFGFVSPAAAVQPPGAPATGHTYTFVSSLYELPPRCPSPERGPPTDGIELTVAAFQHAVGRGSDGASARSCGYAARPAYDYAATDELSYTDTSQHGQVGAREQSGAVSLHRSQVAAKTATPLAKAGSAVVHGNSRLSPKTTYLYRLSDDEGNYLKTGVTSNPGSRYSQKFLVDKRLDFLTSGSRSNMLNLERFIVERDPGPLNFERWAGNFAGDVP